MIQKRKKIDKLIFIKIKNLFSVKATVDGMNKQATDWEKIAAHHISDKELVSRIHKDLSKLSGKETISIFFNGQRTQTLF